MAEHRNHRSDILFAAFVVVLLAAAWEVRQVLLLIYVAALFAIVLGPAVGFIRRAHIGRWHPSRGVAVLLLILTVITFFSLLIVFLAPPIVRDLQAFSQDLPNKMQALQGKVRSVPMLGDRLQPSNLKQYGERLVGGAFGLFAGIAGSLFGFVSLLVLIAYFIIDGDRAFRWILSMFPARHRARLRTTLEKGEERVSMWLFGQALLMLILGTAAAITFKLLGVKYSLALGVFAGLMNIVPIVGPLISAALAVLVAASDGWHTALGVIIFYVAYQQIENAFLTPRIMKSTVDLPALAVVIALALGGKLAGVLGALVAVPTAALISVIANEYLVDEHKTAREEE